MHKLNALTLGVLVALAMAHAASAETPQPQTETPAGPCQRSGMRMTLGGVDTDEMKCQLALAAESVAQQSRQIIALQAKLMLGASDLAAATKRAEEAEAKLAPPEKPADAPKP